MWEVWDNNTSAWISTGVDASSGYTLTKEAVMSVLGNTYAPVNEIRYSTSEAGNIFGDKYLPCDGSFIPKDDYPQLRIPQAGLRFLKASHPQVGYTIYNIAYGNGVYVVACGNSYRMFVSADLRDWKVVSLLPGVSTIGYFVRGVYFDGGAFHSLWYSNYSPGIYLIQKSVDGIGWTAESIAFGTGKSFGVYLCTNGVHVVAGSNQFWTMVGEGSITLRDIGTTSDIRDVVYGNGIFVAAALDLSIITSPDGVEWTNRGVILPKTPSGMIFADGIFVIACSDILLTSTDGIDWAQMDSIGMNIEKIGYGGGVYVIGVRREGYPMYLYTSTNLTDWEEHAYLDPINFSRISWANDTLFFLGYSGYYGISIDALQLPSIENAYIKALE